VNKREKTDFSDGVSFFALGNILIKKKNMILKTYTKNQK